MRRESLVGLARPSSTAASGGRQHPATVSEKSGGLAGGESR